MFPRVMRPRPAESKPDCGACSPGAALTCALLCAAPSTSTIFGRCAWQVVATPCNPLAFAWATPPRAQRKRLCTLRMCPATHKRPAPHCAWDKGRAPCAAAAAIGKAARRAPWYPQVYSRVSCVDSLLHGRAQAGATTAGQQLATFSNSCTSQRTALHCRAWARLLMCCGHKLGVHPDVVNMAGSSIGCRTITRKGSRIWARQTEHGRFA